MKFFSIHHCVLIFLTLIFTTGRPSPRTQHGCPRVQGVGPVGARGNKDIKRTLYDSTRLLQDSRQGTKTPQHPSREPELHLEYSRLPGELPLVFKHHISIQMVDLQTNV